MTITTNEYSQITLDKISKSKNNPRKRIDTNSIKELAQSIKTDGLLHNLVVKPKGGKKKGVYEIISGERRFRALSLLARNGELDKNYVVPVDIRHDIDDEQAKRIATVENLQREDMHPMDEAIAVTSLIQDGKSLEDISAQTGFSIPLIRKRIRLADLCDEAQNALRNGRINLSVAQALTLGTHDQQKRLIEQGLENRDAEDVRYILTDEKIAISKAIFDTKIYKSNITFDLFADENESYFDDREEFFTLQDKAVEELKTQKENEGYSPVEICNESYFGSYQYRGASGDEKGGCVIHYSPYGDVNIHEGIVSRDLDKNTIAEIADRQKATYSQPMCEYFAMHKSIALQSALLANPRKAKEIAVVQLITAGTWQSKINVPFHKCLTYFEESDTLPRTFEDINFAITSTVKSLGMENHHDTACRNLNCQNQPVSDIYSCVKALDDNELDKVHLLLTTLCFGQSGIDLDTDEKSLFNLVANDLNINMLDHWIPDNDFLNRRNVNQLQEIIKETETSQLFGSASSYKKKDIVTILTKHFEKLGSLDKCEEKEMKAKHWLPEAFQFPAIDPDSKQ
ncbi:MAG: ParB/RepB/Spo0J family partition protein [Candidatus Thiodiazotropha sp. (ex Lucinoma kastoroae)]|nr:ParB/RepB/Spo0J family partition protein [Candidatus Thiodiazotropha sp. (ex Lucinoma kastoroae)]